MQNWLEILLGFLHFSHDTSVDVAIVCDDFTWGTLTGDRLSKSDRDYLPSFIVFGVSEISVFVQWWDNSIMVNDIQVQFMRL